MRVVGGLWRGHPLSAPDGRDVTRPTTDRVREAITSSLVSAAGLDLSELRVLDAFAGSGAMAIELVSRGARSATLVEKNRRVQQVIRKNIAAVKARPDQLTLIGGDVFNLATAGRIAGGPFSIVVLDPPYATDVSEVAGLVRALGDHGALAPSALVLYERADKGQPLELEGFELVATKRYGSTCTDLLRMDA